MFDGLGTQWALTLIAFVSLALAPIPFVFYYYGAHIRRNSTFAPGHKPAAPAPAAAATETSGTLSRELTRQEVEAAEVASLDLRQVESRVEQREKLARDGLLDEAKAAEVDRRGE